LPQILLFSVMETLKKFSLIYLALMLYVSSTGFVYVLKTCLHSGKSEIEFLVEKDPKPGCGITADDCCKEIADMSCCELKKAKETDCEKSTIEYKKADLQSIQPDITSIDWLHISPIEPQELSLDFTWLNVEENIFQLQFDSAKDPPEQLLPSGMEFRILLHSFIC